MISESIKKILGEELAASVETTLKGKGKDGKDVDVVIGNDGTYVPADKYDGEKAKAASAEATLKDAAATLKDIGGSGDPEKIKDDVKAASTKLADLQSTHDAEMAKLSKVTALKLALVDDVHDPNDIISGINLDDIQVDDSGTLKTDKESILKPYRESKPYLFKEAETTGEGGEKEKRQMKGAVPGAAKDGAPDTDPQSKTLNGAIENYYAKER